MGLFDCFKIPDINQGVKEYRQASDSILLDVRTPEEYLEGHIPNSLNIPLHTLQEIDQIVSRKDIPIFAYCHSGSRSLQAVHALRQMGYKNVKNIGGIATYTGKVEY